MPPCTNDSGSAIGTAADALVHFGKPCRIDWTVDAGAPFHSDDKPADASWHRQTADPDQLAKWLERGGIVAWVQGRYEIGPRALGHRSLLASPLRAQSRAALNRIKEREDYRPIAPCCRYEELAEWFHPGVEDPYMLSFSHVKTTALPAVTHVDGSARVQSVRQRDEPTLHRLLSAFRELTGYGVLCNTSLNHKGAGFINRMTDLVRYCDSKNIDGFVVDGDWYRRRATTALQQSAEASVGRV